MTQMQRSSPRPAPQKRLYSHGRISIEYEDGKGNLEPPKSLMELLGTLSDPGWDNVYPHFSNISGLGRVGVQGALLGTLLGLHLGVLIMSLGYAPSVLVVCLLPDCVTHAHPLQLYTRSR